MPFECNRSRHPVASTRPTTPGPPCILETRPDNRRGAARSASGVALERRGSAPAVSVDQRRFVRP